MSNYIIQTYLNEAYNHKVWRGEFLNSFKEEEIEKTLEGYTKGQLDIIYTALEQVRDEKAEELEQTKEVCPTKWEDGTSDSELVYSNDSDIEEMDKLESLIKYYDRILGLIEDKICIKA